MLPGGCGGKILNKEVDSENVGLGDSWLKRKGYISLQEREREGVREREKERERKREREKEEYRERKIRGEFGDHQLSLQH